MDNSWFVYSTESGRICNSCGQPTSKCNCKKKKTVKKQSIYPNDGIVRIRREVKGRKGKTVTAVFGVTLDDKKTKAICQNIETSKTPKKGKKCRTWNGKLKAIN